MQMISEIKTETQSVLADSNVAPLPEVSTAQGSESYLTLSKRILWSYVYDYFYFSLMELYNYL